MPDSKGRKPKRSAKPQPRKRVVSSPLPASPIPVDDHLKVPNWKPRKDDRTLEMPSRDAIRERTDKPALPELPEPASYDEVLVTLYKLDPLSQEVLIAQRLAAMPSQKDGGMPVNIPRQVRAPWADQLRKLGFFCIPELATHELVADPGGGQMANHTAASLRKLTTDDFWRMAKEQNPKLAEMVDGADTPEKRQAAMDELRKNLPTELRIAFDRLHSHNPEDLAPR